MTWWCDNDGYDNDKEDDDGDDDDKDDDANLKHLLRPHFPKTLSLHWDGHSDKWWSWWWGNGDDHDH